MALTAVTVRTSLIGLTPLKMHNVQLADPDNMWAEKIAKITSKRKKTEEDRREIARLEFLGGLYVHDNRVVYPQANIKRCFKEAAKATRQGKTIDRALNFADPVIAPRLPLVFNGENMTPEELYNAGGYHDTTIVAVKTSKLPRCRPSILPWGITCEWLVFPNLMGVDELQAIAEAAGLIEGLGDNRVNGDGRFRVEVKEL